MAIDYRQAVNAISDVIQNRPPPLREFDQIYMKAGDMVAQAHFVADRFRDRKLVFIGDGDGIALSVMHLKRQKIIDFGPASIEVLDFDERIVKSIERFADHFRIEDQISSRLYNVADPLPSGIVGTKGAFYTNPPWGASNDGESVCIFLERGMEAVDKQGLGMVVIGDDPEVTWTQEVLLATQQRAREHGFIVSELVPRWHLYHLDDAPDLRSCSMVLSRTNVEATSATSKPIDRSRLDNFYGRNNPLRYRYVRERKTLNYGRAPEDTYTLEPLEGKP